MTNLYFIYKIKGFTKTGGVKILNKRNWISSFKNKQYSCYISPYGEITKIKYNTHIEQSEHIYLNYKQVYRVNKNIQQIALQKKYHEALERIGFITVSKCLFSWDSTIKINNKQIDAIFDIMKTCKIKAAFFNTTKEKRKLSDIISEL